MQTTFELKIRVKLVQIRLNDILEWIQTRETKKREYKMFQNFQVSVQEMVVCSFMVFSEIYFFSIK